MAAPESMKTGISNSNTDLVAKPGDLSDEQMKALEESILAQAELAFKETGIKGFAFHLAECTRALPQLSKARANRLLRSLVDMALKTEGTDKEKREMMLAEGIRWARANNLHFARRQLEVRLVHHYNDTKAYAKALELATTLVNEMKRSNERELLVDVVVEESFAAYALKNNMKARTALVMAKTVSNGVVIPPVLQGALDMQSGVLAAEEADFRTAYSYFVEAHDNYNELGKEDIGEKSARALKYMCLVKILLDDSSSIKHMLTARRIFDSAHVAAIQALAVAFEKRSLAHYHKAYAEHEKQLRDDIFIARHTTRLYEKLFEKEMLRVIEPYRVVELEQLAKMLGMPSEKVQQAVAMLLREKKIYGYIDQVSATLNVQPKPRPDENFVKGAAIAASLTHMIDMLRAVYYD